MATIEYHVKPQGKILAEFAADRSRVSIIIGPLGSGKTVETCQKIFKLMTEQEPNAEGVRQSRWCAVRNTYSDLLNTTMKDWLALYGDLGKYTKGGIEPPKQNLRFKLEDGTTVEAEMIFLALDRDDAVKKLRGMQLTAGWPNELKELNKAVIDMLDLRHGRYPANPTWHGLVCDTNAPDQDHWLYNLAEEDKPEGWKIFKQPGGLKRDGFHEGGKIKWVVNPLAENVNNLPKDYYTTGMQGKSDDWISVNLANEYGYVSDGMAVYTDYNDTLHCAQFEFMPDVPIYRGWDFGVPACVLAQYTPKQRLIARKEFTSLKTMGIDKFAEHVLNECASLKAKGFKFIDVGDPSGDSDSLQKDEVTCFSVLREKGIDIEPSIQNPLARQEGVRYFLTRLIEGRAAFIVHPDCKILRKGFQGGYQYRRLKVAGEKYENKPNKNKFSHPHDCLQYIAAFIRADYVVDEIEESHGDGGRSKVGGY